MSDYAHRAAVFIAELDAAVDVHLDWTRRVLRCALTHEPPGEQMLADDAHERCHFGQWLVAAGPELERLDARKAHQLVSLHRRMHDAIRLICQDVHSGRPGNLEALATFESSQAGLVQRLATFKTRILADAVRLDPLTGLPLRYSLEGEFMMGQRAAHRGGTALFVAMFDIDHFKRVNDTFGHIVGDLALRHLADTLRRILRPNDRLYRYGGEEFLLLMLAEDDSEAEAAAGRFLDAVRASPVPVPGHGDLPLRVTIGLARVAEGDGLEISVERADQALYRGKQAGRDRCVVAG
ncbi:diguanylate cyclase [Arenimonas sp.]|uniref:diguanylate cyclase n=1 Tax=Arenimonas sp. TaxID=1872635 RepID=UPI0035AEAE53